MNADTESHAAFPPSGRILVVDDDVNVNKTLSAFLKKLGFSVLNAFNGAEAIEVMDLNQGEIDLVITDLKMPVMTGRQLLSAMSDRFNHIPRIVLTAVGSDEDIIHALKTGAYDFLTKPITDFNLLNHSVKRALERKRLNDERNLANLQLEKMFEIISVLNQGQDIEEVFNKIDISLKPFLPFSRISLFYSNDREHSFTLKQAHSDRNMLMPIGQTIILDKNSYKKILSNREIVLIPDLEEYLAGNNLPDLFRLFLDEGMKSAVLLPLIIDEFSRGFMFFASDMVSAYTHEHTRFLKLIGGQIALSIQRGELISQLELHSKHLEHMVRVRTHELLKTQKTTIFALSKLAETRDNETGAHLERMRNYCILLAQIMKYSGEFDLISSDFMRNIYDSCILHDIGKVGIPDMILLKPGNLTKDEYETIKTHTVIGYNALNDASRELGENSFLDMAKDVALYHHERWDGLGYPKGLKADEIPLSARIVTIGDIYDAMTSRRPYKEAFSHEETIRIMQDESYRFDPRIFRLFIDNHEDFDRIKRQFS